VRWDVAGTAVHPIHTEQVRITLSLDGGQSFPITLAEATPNDGSESVNLPQGRGEARIKVAAVGNIYFDINDADLSLGASAIRIAAMRRADGQLQIQWASKPGATYRVQARGHLDDSSWHDAEQVVAQGETATALFKIEGPLCFFRVAQDE
jgi:hypothetical protein